ncbi:MAG: hypothetical protein COA33_013590 [Fluviicola sp.]|nr:hypothetical protein [Fluviicola sp.]
MEQGFAVIIAWPDTLCKQAGAWYDKVIQPIGFGTNGYYQVGHAAVVLVNSSGDCFYYDFGRYHSPFGHGRVRGVNTDHDLLVNTKVEFTENGTPILEQLFDELNNNKSCHGDGLLRAGTTPVDFDVCKSHIQSFQEQDYIPYGPFIKSGTNCSRFVRDVALKGTLERQLKVTLRLPWMLTPSPMWNVKQVGEYVCASETQVAEANTAYEIA